VILINNIMHSFLIKLRV